MSDNELGPLVRLWGVTTAQLPEPSETPDNLAPFLISILQEAVPFVDSVAPKNSPPASGVVEQDGSGGDAIPSATSPSASRAGWKARGSKTYPESAAKVDLSELVVPSTDLERVAGRSAVPPQARPRHDARIPAETWVCRRSVHADSAVPGERSASWSEFRDAIKDRHAESEKAYTPSVVGARAAVVWDCGGVEAVEAGETWGRFTLRVEEVRHRIGKPVMKDRVFPILQMTCSAMESHGSVGSRGDGDVEDAAAVSRKEKPEFLVVSIAVTDFGTAAPQAELTRGKGVVVGAYTSVERIRKLPDSGDIEWIMTTASDARGVLPMWVQTMAVPGQIARDVPLFLSWIAKERAREVNSTDRPPVAAGTGIQEAGKDGDAPPTTTDVGPTEEGEVATPTLRPAPPAKDGPEVKPTPASPPPKTAGPTPGDTGEDAQGANEQVEAKRSTGAADSGPAPSETPK